ncbi:MAG: translation elongation factor Ts [Johnsonella sp.]|nr:translation elongation factor Ts [Johnsonella sp.]
MAEITAALVKELREITGAGMMDCKKALTATEGDLDKAVDFLREKGLAGAQKKAGRIAAEGVVETAICCCGQDAVIVEVNAETDFVAKNEKFKGFVAEVASQVLKSESKNIEEFMEEKWLLDESLSVKDKLSSMISVIGENMSIRRFEKVKEPKGLVVDYIHAGGKIGVLVDIETDVVNEAIKEMGKNLAMQIAALRPVYTSEKEISAEYLAKEREIILAQIKNDPKESQKPDHVINGMVNGRLNKQLKEICLLDQVYVKAEDGKQSVAKYVEETAKANSANLNVKGFIRFETGEGLEKKSEDFAAEVAKQMA